MSGFPPEKLWVCKVCPRAAEKLVALAAAAYWVSKSSRGPASVAVLSIMATIPEVTTILIDDRVCDCCQTDACMTPKGPILVYRNRSEDEIRDIYYTLFTDGHWTTPKAIHDDHWKINGCPVNGPAIAASGNRVAIVWYTEAGGAPSIKMVYSENAGDTFSEPILIPSRHTLARLDLVWKNDDHVLISYLDKQAPDSESATIKLYQYSIKDGRSNTYELDQVSSKRKSGIPKMENYKQSPSGESNLILAYTLISDDGTRRIKSIKVKW